MKAKRKRVEASVDSITLRFELPDGSEWDVTLKRVRGITTYGLRTVWRKVQEGIAQAFAGTVKEWRFFRPRSFDVDWSARRVSFQLSKSSRKRRSA